MCSSCSGVLTSLNSSLSSPTTTLFSGVGYNAAGEVTGWASGTTAGGTGWRVGMSAGYDGDLRLSSSALNLTNVTANTTNTIASVAPGYDAVSNVTSVTTTLAPVSGVSGSGGGETQAFCYDDLNRLVWASTQASGSPCGRTGSEGVSGAGYTASYAYDLINDITSASVLNQSGSPLPTTAQGAYAYNTANAAGHLHAVSSVSGSEPYSAGYDAAGDITCRALGSLSCTTNGAPTGQLLGYDALRRLVAWQNATTSPTATASYAYDGEGTRVWQQTTSGPGGAQTTTTTAYLLGHDEQTTTQPSGQQPTTTATRYYPTPGGALLVRDASGLSYLATDHLGTPIATVNLDSGAVLGEQLRAPYGEARYGVAAGAPLSGGMHSSVGFTGQREDTASSGGSGLDYFNARYYDVTVGRFASVDTHLNADLLLDNYDYVGGSVETRVDPSGHDPSDWIPGFLLAMSLFSNMVNDHYLRYGPPVDYPIWTTTTEKIDYGPGELFNMLNDPHGSEQGSTDNGTGVPNDGPPEGPTSQQPGGGKTSGGNGGNGGNGGGTSTSGGGNGTSGGGQDPNLSKERRSRDVPEDFGMTETSAGIVVTMGQEHVASSPSPLSIFNLLTSSNPGTIGLGLQQLSDAVLGHVGNGVDWAGNQLSDFWDGLTAKTPQYCACGSGSPENGGASPDDEPFPEDGLPGVEY